MKVHKGGQDKQPMLWRTNTEDKNKLDTARTTPLRSCESGRRQGTRQ